MGDVGDAFRAMNEAGKEHRTDKQNWSRELLEHWCLENGVEMKAIADWQFRLQRKDRKIDIYPQRQKWHNLKNNSRGKYKDLISFIAQHFNNTHIS